MSYIELHLHTFTLSNLQCSQLSVLSQKPSTSCDNKVYSQPCYRMPSLPYFPSSPSFLICYHLSLSLSSLPHLHYPPPSLPDIPLSLLHLHLLLLHLLAAFLVVEPRPGPSGPGVPDGLAGRWFRTDLSAADPILPQTSGGPLGGKTLLKQVER